MNQYIEYANTARKTDTTIGGGIANILSMLPGFAGELITTGGVFTAAKTPILKAVEHYGGAKALKYATESLPGRVAVGLPAAVPQTIAAGPGHIAEKTYSNILKNYEISKDDAGKIKVLLGPEGEKPLASLGFGVLDYWIEVGSEKAGGPLAKSLNKYLKKIPGVERAAAWKAAIISRWLSTKPNAKIDGLIAAVKKYGNWHGPVWEMVEEEIANLARLGLGEEHPLAAAYKKGGWGEVGKDLLTMYIAFTVPGGTAQAIKKIAGSFGDEPPEISRKPKGYTPPGGAGCVRRSERQSAVPAEEILGTPEPTPPDTGPLPAGDILGTPEADPQPEETIAAAVVDAQTPEDVIATATAAASGQPAAPLPAAVEPAVATHQIPLSQAQPVAPAQPAAVQPEIGRIPAEPAAAAQAPVAAPPTAAPDVAPLPPPAAPAKSFAQPRDRSRPASIAQMNEIASKPDYLRLGPGRAPESGAPLAFANADAANIPADRLGSIDIAVLSDGRRLPFRYAVVDADTVQPSNLADGSVNKAHDSTEPGVIRALSNGRVAGLRAAHERGTAAPYVEALLADVQAHGISAQAIQGVQRPMLIRLYSEADNTGDIGALSQGATLGMSGTEQGISDANLLSGDILALHKPADITSPANQEFVRAFVGSVADRSSMLDAQGQLSQAGRRRIEAALMVAAYGDAALVSELFESTETDIKAIGDALRETAGLWAAMRDAAKDKVIDPLMDTTGNLMAAVALDPQGPRREPRRRRTGRPGEPSGRQVR